MTTGSSREPAVSRPVGEEVPVTVQIPAPLRTYCGGASELPLPAQSVRDALEQLERHHPSLYATSATRRGRSAAT